MAKAEKKGKSSEWRRNILFENIGKKLLAIVVGISLWFVANMENEIEKSVAVEVNYSNLSEELIIVNKPAEKLNLSIRGPRAKLTSFSPSDFAYSLDIGNITPGVSKFEILTDQIKVPRGVQVTGVSPGLIEVEADKLEEKEVRVNPVVGETDEGFEVASETKVSPSKIKIKGPARILSKIESVSTDLVPTVGVRTEFTIQVPLKTPNSLVRIVGNETARVTVNIKEITVAKEFKDIEINFVNFSGVKFTPLGGLKAELEFEGRYSIIKDLNSGDINVFVDGSGVENGKKKSERLKINVSFPAKETLVLKKMFPDSVEIRLN
ncbi:MAG: CdaR family protein [Deltaproteobacteria bacterium]